MPLGANSSLFEYNRQRLVAHSRGGIYALSAYTLMQRSNDLFFPFEQEANFWWLSGVEQPNWWLILDASRGKCWLIAPDAVELTHSDYDEVRRSSGVKDVLSQDAGIQLLRDLSKKHSIVRTIGERTSRRTLLSAPNPAIKKMQDTLVRIFNTVQDCRKEFNYLRAVKQPGEITRIKKAVNLTAAGFDEMKSQINDLKYEYEIEAGLTHYFRKHGAAGNSYDPVVASGVRACDLEYISNQAKIRKRDAVLIDAGARFDGYTASISRTYMYGDPTRRQAIVYGALKNAHDEITQLISPNFMIDQYYKEAEYIMKEMLLTIGLMTDMNDMQSFHRYFPHAVSHGIGIDVHEDLGSYQTFQPGMVMTVEPGIYIPKEKIGMRLGDTILVTSDGSVSLSGRLSTDL